MLICAFPWMAGSWRVATAPLQPVVKDINGTVVSVGDTVTITGKIVTIFYDSLTDGELVILPNTPIPSRYSVQCSSLSVIK